MKYKNEIVIVLMFLNLTIILQNESRGQTGWYTLNSIYQVSYKAVYFLDNNTGFLAGDGNVILRTTNGGLTWNNTNPGGISFNASGIYFLNSTTGWFCAGMVYTNGAYNYYVFKTSNAGETWTVIYSASYFSLGLFFFPGSIKFLDENTGIMTFWGKKSPNLQTYTGKILRTTTGGESWSRVDSNLAFYSVSGTEDKLAVAGFYRNENYNDTGYIKTSSDRGLTWRNSLVYPDGGYFSADMTDPNTIYAAGWTITDSQYATVSKTTNFGRIWTNNQVRAGRFFTGVDMIDSSTGWTSGNLGLIYKTTNAGVNWNSQTTPTGQLLNSIYFVNSSYGYSVGENNTIIKTTTGGELISSYFSEETNIPEFYSLHQNYPNPFNYETQIQFDIPVQTKLILKVFDTSGREVSILIDEFKNAGHYTKSFDASPMASGIYFYRIETENFVMTRKMILLK